MNRIVRPALAVLAAASLIAGVACSNNEKASPATSTAAQQASFTAGQGTDSPSSGGNVAQRTGELTTAALVKLAEPAIVRIQTNGGVGSGFVVAEDGFIVTNNHVVAGAGSRAATNINVTMSDGAAYRATIVGTDPRSDLAVIKIDASGLKPLKLGSLEQTAVGQDVVAIGYALDLKGGEGPSFTVTRGIVSAKNRGVDETAQNILGTVQTDAAINHGNSGGPLLNLFGDVVGVNSSIAPDTTTGGIAPGIGFAIGVDTVKAVYEQIRANGKVNRGLLGVQNFGALRPAQAKSMNLPEDTAGVYLDTDADLVAGGPAAQAGIKSGDVIVKIGKYVIRNEADLAVAMIGSHPGDKVDIELYRAGKKVTVQVTLGTPSQ